MAIKKNEAPLANIAEKTTEFELTLDELNELKSHCEIFNDFVKTPLINLRKLQKNRRIIADLVDKYSDDGDILNTRLEKLRIELSSKPTDMDLITQKNEVFALIKAFNRKKYKVNLYTMDATDFPTDVKEFGKRILNKGQMGQVEIEYVTSFIALSGTIITEEEI